MKWVDVIPFGLFFDKKLSKNNKKNLVIQKIIAYFASSFTMCVWFLIF